ncbi:signal peptidase complex catalytic subunit SEC11A isoform X3 [Prinia subflava]|uniref:signal peptidase complex catalytic subunit SEC11A isoform X3 n=1 Tax=Prinia subflava TaxID=208062 RepID=UPI002FE1F702
MLSLDFLDDVRRMNKRQLYYQVLNFGMIVSSALMIWKGLMVVTGSESPIVVVLSGSMEPAFHRGDLLFLTNRIEDPIRVGEIVVFRIEGREIPIVHRVLKIHEKVCSPNLLSGFGAGQPDQTSLTSDSREVHHGLLTPRRDRALTLLNKKRIWGAQHCPEHSRCRHILSSCSGIMAKRRHQISDKGGQQCRG